MQIGGFNDSQRGNLVEATIGFRSVEDQFAGRHAEMGNRNPIWKAAPPIFVEGFEDLDRRKQGIVPASRAESEGP